MHTASENNYYVHLRLVYKRPIWLAHPHPVWVLHAWVFIIPLLAGSLAGCALASITLGLITGLDAELYLLVELPPLLARSSRPRHVVAAACIVGLMLLIDVSSPLVLDTRTDVRPLLSQDTTWSRL